MSITRQQAALLFAYDFKLVDKEGNEYTVLYPTPWALSLQNKYGVSFIAEYNKIGVDYFILAHNYSCLTKQINGVIPIQMLAKMAFPKKNWNKRGVATIPNTYDNYHFYYSKVSFFMRINDKVKITAPKQPELFDAMYSLGFLPHSIEESNVKWIEL